MRYLFIIVFIIAGINCVNPLSYAALHINEIYPAPTSGEQEWVEIYNDEGSQIDISGYYLNDAANNKITLPSIIEPLGFVITTSSNILNNSGDTVILKNNLNETIESVTYSGSFSSDKTYAKCPDGNGTWQTLTMITKNQSNSSACPTSTPTPTLTPTPTETPTLTSTPTPEPPTPTALISLTPSPTPTTPTPTPTPTSYDNIIISEVMVNPESEGNEWVELYNDNEYEVTLNSWYIDDEENTGSLPKSFSSTIQGKSYGTIDLTTSIFNNEGDSVRLLDFNKTEKARFDYSSSEKGESWGKDGDSYCLQNASKSEKNNSCILDETPQISQTTPIPLKPTLTSTPQTVPTSIKSRIAPIPLTVRTFPTTQPTPTAFPPMVLGSSTSFNIDSLSDSRKLQKSLSFSSLSFSLLAMLSLITKISLSRNEL